MALKIIKTEYRLEKKSGIIFLVSLLMFFQACQSINNLQRLPGRQGETVLLPNGWQLSPAGRQIKIGDLPLNLLLIDGGRFAVTLNSGMADNSISLIDLNKCTEVQKLPLYKVWRGLAFDEKNGILYASGGNGGCIYKLKYKSGGLTLQDSILLGAVGQKQTISVSGLTYLSGKNTLLAVSRYDNSLYVIDIVSGKIIKPQEFEEQCFEIIANKKGTLAYISIWGKSKVLEIDLSGYKITRQFLTGDHPCEMLLNKDEKILYVTNANQNSVSVIDLEKGYEIEKLNSSLSPELPPGSTPNSICFDRDGKRLFVANADNNSLAVFEIGEKQKSRSLGFIPTGWYPTAVRYDEKNNCLIVANGKGGTSMANPSGPNPLMSSEKQKEKYIGRLFTGTVSVIEMPDDKNLDIYAAQVYQNTPLNKAIDSNQSIIPVYHNGSPSEKIKYVYYIIKENRTYDQVFGDITTGNGDSSLCIFPERITPNQHKLASDYCLFDNFYCDAEVSADGHNWSTAAYATDYVEKNWPIMYGNRGGKYEYEGGYPIAAPSSGYIWDAAIKAGVTFRNYGEYVERTEKSGSVKYIARDENLVKFTCEDYPGFDLNISDIFRLEQWMNDFDSLQKRDSLPRFSLIRLPNNHTMGTRKNCLTPTAYVAQNDLALGKMVEHITKSAKWKESIIFVVEDDAQNGADHVDAHRSCLLVISPYVKKNSVDHTMYSSSGVLKTIELIFGMTPMTQYDYAATPIVNCMGNIPNERVFYAIQPNTDMDARNIGALYGSAKCEEMAFEKEDLIPDIEFNEIIWKSIKGSSSIMPSPVHSAFVKTILAEDDD